jgi:hypothetical protein
VLGLPAREHDGDARRPLRTFDALDVRQLCAEEIAVEEEQRRERLILCRGGDDPLGGEVREESADLVHTHLCRVSLAVKEDEALNPIGVGALGADAMMLQPQAPPDLLKERQSFSHGVLRVLRTVLGGMRALRGGRAVKAMIFRE